MHQEKIILKRKDEEELKLNYSKVYDLSKLDMIPKMNSEKKYSLLITLKKILLCTNKYVDICNKKEIIHYCFASLVIFVIYITFLSPIVKIYFLTEEQSDSLQYFDIYKKFYYYTITQIIEIIFRLFFNYFRKRKIRKILLYYARNELSKIKEDFRIEINENFDLTISKTKKDINYFKKKENHQNDFFQYVICYPNIRYYNWDQNILNDNEKIISTLIKTNIQIIEDKFMFKYSFSAVIIFVIYLIAFYFLTKAKVKYFLIFMIALFLFTKIISIILSIDMKKSLALNEEIVSKYYIAKGYFVSFSTSVISIFKLNNSYCNCNIDLNETYKRLIKEVTFINEQFNIF